VSPREEPARTMRVRIGRLVIDGRVAAESGGAIGESIEAELASLLSNGAPVDAHGQTSTSLARSIAVSIASRLDARGIRAESPAPAFSRSPDAPHRVTNG